jgi:hypothetical protein
VRHDVSAGAVVRDGSVCADVHDGSHGVRDSVRESTERPCELRRVRNGVRFGSGVLDGDVRGDVRERDDLVLGRVRGSHGGPGQLRDVRSRVHDGSVLQRRVVRRFVRARSDQLQRAVREHAGGPCELRRVRRHVRSGLRMQHGAVLSAGGDGRIGLHATELDVRHGVHGHPERQQQLWRVRSSMYAGSDVHRRDVRGAVHGGADAVRWNVHQRAVGP